MQRDFKGIWIPKEVWLAEDLTVMEKLFLVEIDSLDNSRGCFATNDYFAKFFDLSESRVSKIINCLVAKNVITITIIKADGNRRILHTLLKKTLIPYRRKQRDPIGENSETLSLKSASHNKDSNTVNNTTNKNAPDSLALFKKFFPHYEPPIFSQDLIVSRIADLTRWRTALEFWAANDYRPQSVGKICDYYDELKTSDTQPMITPEQLAKERDDYAKTFDYSRTPENTMFGMSKPRRTDYSSSKEN